MKKIKSLSVKIIKDNLRSFEKGVYAKDEGREPLARGASFDYCFNYFQGFESKKELIHRNNIQHSCLHLAFYLASWGMLRGSSFLLQKSIKFYERLIEYISKKEESFWKIDVSNYNEDNNIEKLLLCAKEIRRILGENGKNKVSDTLTTKIMLGVFGNVPAFDSYFKAGSGLSTFNQNVLRQIYGFYKSKNYSEIISNEAKRMKTFEYHEDTKQKRLYTKGKVIDAIFFVQGYKRSRKIRHRINI